MYSSVRLIATVRVKIELLIAEHYCISNDLLFHLQTTKSTRFSFETHKTNRDEYEQARARAGDVERS